MQPGVVGELCRPSLAGEDPIPSVGAAGMGCSFPAGCWVLVPLVSRAVVADPTPRNLRVGFPGCLWDWGSGSSPARSLTQPHLPPAGMSPSSPAGLESIESHLPVPPSRNLPGITPGLWWFHGAARLGGSTIPIRDCECCRRCREAERG